ncbi:MAG: hypothetical protein AB7J34_03945 [Limisphaerales bacterium]
MQSIRGAVLRPFTACLVLLAPGLATLGDDLVIPGGGSDGDLDIIHGTVGGPISQVTVTNVVNGVTNVVHETVFDLGKATTARWDAPSTADDSNIHVGVYDPERWAVVFKYRKVSLAGGVRLTFKDHPSRAPVVWLVQETVAIAEGATLDLSGRYTVRDTVESLEPSEAGPGGFRGPAHGPGGSGWGFGPGGLGDGAGYRNVYGNPRLLPLIGGSGGFFTYQGFGRWGSSGGGGAILIAAGQSVEVDGSILARGGSISSFGNAGGGSGGAIRIVAPTLKGDGLIDAEPEGRTRLEVESVESGVKILPNAVAVQPVPEPIIWAPSTAPTVRITRVHDQGAPVDPRADLRTDPDVRIEENAVVDIELETVNLPIEGVVQLRVGPKYGAASWIKATFAGGDINKATWKASTLLPPGFTVLQARATAP